ncbi:hypothetical protein GGTG_10223 [Gaeumannomyces tritici R3-111a-1]|uniref:Uncharacterized protein n=1 Tax=Gaeumannomyces tritici (strain R3-111a-1) TaxID=644352 RepID=J3P9P6_GAET3|nr:hypothetical protein GGTG_10223 [Gaeumannomyces tritici R3-111a-1]EJT73382.1 hypothetical protein GGTG_10223 [Gaeumannomyces tritici R3-111a-1]
MAPATQAPGMALVSARREDIDPQQCLHYAQFASRLDRWHFDFLYWVLFATNILLLSIASFWYSRTNDKTKDMVPTNPEFVRHHKRCLYVTIALASLAVVMSVIEVFALLALQFCDGEDLMALYWATWTMLQFGSVIAIFGIILHIILVLQGQDRPPWALALGTPVLVVAGVGNLINSALHRKTTKVIKKTKEARSRSNSRSGTVPMSQAPTIRPESMDSDHGDRPTMQQATVVGTATDGGVIIQLSRSDPELESRGTFLGRDNDGRVLVSFRQDKVVVVNGPAALEGVLVNPRQREQSEPVRAGHRHKGSAGSSFYEQLPLPPFSSLDVQIPPPSRNGVGSGPSNSGPRPQSSGGATLTPTSPTSPNRPDTRSYKAYPDDAAANSEKSPRIEFPRLDKPDRPQ